MTEFERIKAMDIVEFALYLNKMQNNAIDDYESGYFPKGAFENVAMLSKEVKENLDAKARTADKNMSDAITAGERHCDGPSVSLEITGEGVSETINDGKIAAAKQCLIDNGMEADEADQKGDGFMELDFQFILDSLKHEASWKAGDCVSFSFENWDLTIRRESDQYDPFAFLVSGKKRNTNETISRRYIGLENAYLHILNRFNENADIENRFKSLSDIMEYFTKKKGTGVAWSEYQFGKEEHALRLINDAIKLGILQEGTNGGVMVYKLFDDGNEGWQEVDKDFAAKDLIAQNMVSTLSEKIKEYNTKSSLDAQIESTSSRSAKSHSFDKARAKEPDPER